MRMNKKNLDFYENTPWYIGKDGMSNTPLLILSIFLPFPFAWPINMIINIFVVIAYRRYMTKRIKAQQQATTW